jgi:NADH:ubiquinone oxidoreductase subunit E
VSDSTSTRAGLSDAALAELEKLGKRYPTREALLLPALWMVQQEHGWISQESMLYLAELLDVSPVRVYGVVSFYHMFHDRPPGRYNNHEVTPDGRFMVTRVECLGACEHAPVCQINEDFEFDLTPEQLEAKLEQLP